MDDVAIIGPAPPHHPKILRLLEQVGSNYGAHYKTASTCSENEIEDFFDGKSRSHCLWPLLSGGFMQGLVVVMENCRDLRIRMFQSIQTYVDCSVYRLS